MAEGNFNTSLKMLTGSFNGPAGSCADFVAELPFIADVNFEGYSQNGEFDVTFPLFESSFCGGYPNGDFNVSFYSLTANFSGNMTGGYFAVTFPLLKAQFVTSKQQLGNFNISLPLLMSDFSGYLEQRGNFAVIIPLLQGLFEGGDITYLCLVLHNETALTEWDFAHTIDSFVELDGDIYLASESGLFLLGGGTGDHEDSIVATIQTGLNDGGIPNFKQITGHYFTYRSNNNLQFQFIADDETDITIHELRTTGNKVKTRWGMTEKGSRGRCLGAKITNSFLNSDFRIMSLDILTKVLYRKHTDR